MTTSIHNLGLVPYAEAMERMNELHAKRVKDEIPNTLLFLEHPAIVTRGRRLHHNDQSALKFRLEAQGIDLANADRGGELTYHGPGQIVIYFIVKLTQPLGGATDMVTVVEKIMNEFMMEEFGILSESDSRYPGLWFEGKKFMSIGLRVEKGVTKHGISLNLNPDLTVYNFFEPCGMSGSVMTSVSKILNSEISCDDKRLIVADLMEHWRQRSNLLIERLSK